MSGVGARQVTRAAVNAAAASATSQPQSGPRATSGPPRIGVAQIVDAATAAMSRSQLLRSTVTPVTGVGAPKHAQLASEPDSRAFDQARDTSSV
jgi:hypothetical protein